MGSNPDARRLAGRSADLGAHAEFDLADLPSIQDDPSAARAAAESLRITLEGLLAAPKPIIVASALDPDGNNRVGVALRLLPVESIWLSGRLLSDRKALLHGGLRAMRELGIVTDAEALAFTDWRDATAAVARHRTKFVVVIDRPELIDGMPSYDELLGFCDSWPTMHLIVVTVSPPPDDEASGFARLQIQPRAPVGAAFGVHDPLNRAADGTRHPVGHTPTRSESDRVVRDLAEDIAADVSAGDYVGAHRRLWSVDLASIVDPALAHILVSAMAGAIETGREIRPEWIAQRMVLEVLEGSGSTQRTLQFFNVLTDRAPAPTVLDTKALTIALATVVGYLAEGDYRRARVAGAGTAEVLLGTPWIQLRALGVLPGLFWACAAAAELFGGDLAASEPLASSALEWGQSTGSRATRLLALAVLSNYHALRGNVEHVLALREDARSLRREGSWPSSDNLHQEFLARFCLARFSLDHAAIVELLEEIDAIPEPWPSLTYLREICACFATLLGAYRDDALDAALHLVEYSDSHQGHVRLSRLATQVVFDVLHSVRPSRERQAVLAHLLDSSRAEGCQLGKVLILDAPDPASIITGTEACVSLQGHHSRPDLTALLLARATAFFQLGDARNAQHSLREAVAEGALLFPISFLYVPVQLLVPVLELAPEIDRGSVRRLLNTLGRIGRRPDVDAASPVATLSRRERGILESLEGGGTLDDIARDSFLSRNTVKSHVRAVYRKLGVSTRDEAVAMLAESRVDANAAGRVTSPVGHGQLPASGVSLDPSLLI
jgi:DNA-binding NarL/FixJ family response regulator